MNNTNLSEKLKEALKQNIINFFELKDEGAKRNNNNLCITGKWGSGKTTFIEKFLEENEFKDYKKYIFPVWIYEITDNKFLYLLFDIIDKIVPEKEIEAKLKIKKLAFNLLYEFANVKTLGILKKLLRLPLTSQKIQKIKMKWKIINLKMI